MLCRIVSAVGVAHFFGSMAMSPMNHGPLGERGLFIHFAAFGAVFCALAFPLMVFVAAYGFSLAQAGVHWSTILQREIPPHLAGRVFSLTGIIGNCAMPAGFVLFGLSLDRFPLALTLGISGALLIFFTCAFLALVARGPRYRTWKCRTINRS